MEMEDDNGDRFRFTSQQIGDGSCPSEWSTGAAEAILDD